VESTVVAFSDPFLIEKISFFYYFLHTERETKEHSLNCGAVEYTCTVDLSHILSFHANCILSASQPIYIALYCISIAIVQLHLAIASSPALRAYQNTLVSLLSFLDGHKYHKDTLFLQDHLSAITAENILKWMNLKAFGSINPGPDANPTGCRSSTILFWKKSISFFIPNKHHPWDSLLCRGNPTRLREILLDLVKYIKKKEVWRQGVPSQARRPLNLTEFRSVYQALKTEGNSPLAKFGIPAQMCFQFHLIARIDCVCQLQRSNLKSHERFTLQALKVKFNWSKNVLEEQDAPWQTVLGSIDSTFCVLLNLSLWLEILCRRHSISKPTLLYFHCG
jgi:hypothetical protein